jgi:hypothetical protein
MEAMTVAANTEIIIASRRFGKSHGIIGPRIIRNVQAMPGSTGCYVASSFRQALTRTLPAAIAGLESLGYRRNLHFVIGRRPPKRLGYLHPIIVPDDYANIISFYNGSIIMLVSQDVNMSSNSATFDYIIGDEAKGLDYDKLKSETFPANGGSRRFFQSCPWHHGVLFVSDMPVDKEGRWLLNYREKSDPEVIDCILTMMIHLQEVQRTNPADRETIGYLKRTISRLRRIAVYYREWSIFENIDVVGLNYVRQMKRDLPPLVFQTSILSRRIERLHDGFYPAFRESLHTYIANNNDPLIDDGYTFDKNRDYGCSLDGDLDTSKPIAIALDYNANINFLVAGQIDGVKLKVLKSFYVKYERKLRELIDDFCNYYRYHKTREVVYYYDATAIGNNYAVSKDDDYAAIVQQQFAKHGWKVTKNYLGKPMRHSDKYLLINDCFKGAKHLLPILNKENNEALIIAISLAEVSVGIHGFTKCKGGEKLVESEDDPLEYRTDGTDAFDTLVIGCCLYPYTSSGISFGSAVVR